MLPLMTIMTSKWLDELSVEYDYEFVGNQKEQVMQRCCVHRFIPRLQTLGRGEIRQNPSDAVRQLVLPWGLSTFPSIVHC